MAAYYTGDTGGTDDSPVILGDRATFANPRYVSADFFAVFGQTASAGRLLTEGDYSVARWAKPSGSALSNAHCWGWRMRARVPLHRRLMVVSWPASSSKDVFTST